MWKIVKFFKKISDRRERANVSRTAARIGGRSWRFRLIRAVSAPTGRGPGNGQFALQAALRRRGPPWLAIGGPLRPGEIPWFWSWEDRETAALCARTGQPFVAGPNILFAQSRDPCRLEAEREICRAASCRMLFTESEWYRQLIEEHRGPANRARSSSGRIRSIRIPAGR